MMRKTTALLLVMLLLTACFGSLAENAQKAPDFIMEGFDGAAGNHVWETNLFFSRMQERTGVSFQFRQYTEDEKWAARKQGLLEGEDLPDVLFKAGLSVDETRTMYENGYLLDLRPYLESSAPDLWALLQAHPEWTDAISMPDGAIPALPAINELQNNNVMWINTDWLARLKLEKPSTAEELTEVLRAFKTGDPNRASGADEVPLTFIGMWDLRFLGHAFGIVDNDYYVSVKDGKVTSSLTTEENRQFLTWLHQLWQEGLLDPLGFSTNDTLRQITDDKKAIPYGVMLGPSPLLVVPSAALSQYETLEPLIWNGERVYRDFLGDVIRGTFALTSTCKEPEKLISWVNYLYTPEGSRMAQCGLEGEEYIWNEDGYWQWNEDMTTVANQILPEHTIAEGGAAPGLTSVDYQLKYGDEETRRNIEMLNDYRQFTVLPYPLVMLSREDEARVAELHGDLMAYAESAMAGFVAGDQELNDENWQVFVETVEQKGIRELIDIWQKYVK